MAPQGEEPVFYNWPFGIFQGNDLEEYLVDQGIETVAPAGVATGMAVGTAAFALADRLYNLIVPIDTATDGNKELHEVIFKSMIPAIALVTTTDDVIAHLELRTGPDRAPLARGVWGGTFDLLRDASRRSSPRGRPSRASRAHRAQRLTVEVAA